MSSANFQNSEIANESDDDPVTAMLQRTGCIELHYKVQVGFIFFTLLTLKNSYFPFFLGVYR